MEAGPFRKRRLFKLELVKESDGDIAQGSENVLGGGAQAAVEGVEKENRLSRLSREMRLFS